jgi:mannose-6-phosphate isomerase-like protein (cupin superfamily)
MRCFDLGEVRQRREQLGRPYLEFLRVHTLSLGVYHLKAGEPDRQAPHSEDEVYYIVSGRGWFQAGAELQPVHPGAVLFVEKQVEHRFFDIAEDLTALVFFAPAEGSAAGQPPAAGATDVQP